MTLERLLKRALRPWQSWQTRRRMYRAMPGLRLLDEAEREAQRRHRRGVNDIQKAKHNVILSALRKRA